MCCSRFWERGHIDRYSVPTYNLSVPAALSTAAGLLYEVGRLEDKGGRSLHRGALIGWMQGMTRERAVDAS
jgi:hypothetical protein